MPPKITKPSKREKTASSNFTGAGRSLSGDIVPATRRPAARKGKKSAFTKKSGLHMLDELRKDLEKRKNVQDEVKDDSKDGDYQMSEGEEGQLVKTKRELKSSTAQVPEADMLFSEKFGEGKKLEENDGVERDVKEFEETDAPVQDAKENQHDVQHGERGSQ